ncbi:helix-turn-helix domain-containing protein [Eubacterium sp.]|uniref:helix-turn-helix domain-containing protein n=1 Tax=Eubacterium sp. TaxID=142586 RepID=UPI002FCC7F88
MYERIIELLSNSGLSARKLELELGFTKDTIGRIKNHIPSVDKIAKIAKFFDVTMEYLYSGKPCHISQASTPTNPTTLKNEADLLQMLYAFKDVRTQTLFVGRAGLIANQMLEGPDQWDVGN